MDEHVDSESCSHDARVFAVDNDDSFLSFSTEEIDGSVDDVCPQTKRSATFDTKGRKTSESTHSLSPRGVEEAGKKRSREEATQDRPESSFLEP